MTTTSHAADIIGIRYETLRNWLKLGLLTDPGRKADGRRSWRSYGPADLARIRIVKDALQSAVTLDTAIGISNDAEVVAHLESLADTRHPSTALGGPYVLIWPGPPEAQFMIAAGGQIVQELRRNPAPAVIFDLADIAARV